MKEKIVIVGAGVSGLVAAINLEKAGFKPIVIDQSDRVGGRVKTDYRDGLQFDHGFQVLLKKYPAAVKYLDYDLLELQDFYPGSCIFYKQSKFTIGDPSRKSSLLFPTIFAKIGSVSDKWKVLQLSNAVKKKSFDDIFLAPEQTTLAYLQNKGFSDEIIQKFFKPFFTGIFLEDELSTSSRKFEFVYKMFAEGNAAIPKKGIQAIPNQLAAQLKQTQFEFNMKVAEIKDQELILENKKKIPYDYAIIAAEAWPLISNLKNQESKWKSVENLYFEVKNKVIDKPLIGLVADEAALINNIHYQNIKDTNHFLLSVSVVKLHHLNKDDLIKQVEKELQTYCGIESVEFKRYYKIKKALPVMYTVNYMMPPSETQLKDRVFLAGDQLSNGSLNAAMLNGESAARAVIAKIKDGFININ
ncbi:protoporphyrinogen/coproporphyrinogen oxidase [Psychroflexus planctonicus]|uniref:Oxidoreductase n=1 Tax=Psychroflexus planctonicus TaxID=1526575 RepID=A0ABQ1SMX3_9FLAO|nr:NAD(P)/FAD-dependent oxidoreductase [Psychroflexus planctonicus]GGE44714.1 oxidoreductase [Psychroflexus planctonicus]